jgi:hypothetical protein
MCLYWRTGIVLYTPWLWTSRGSIVKPLSKQQERTTHKQPDDSAYEYGDVLNGINNACAIPFHLALLTGPHAFSIYIIK